MQTSIDRTSHINFLSLIAVCRIKFLFKCYKPIFQQAKEKLKIDEPEKKSFKQAKF